MRWFLRHVDIEVYRTSVMETHLAHLPLRHVTRFFLLSYGGWHVRTEEEKKSNIPQWKHLSWLALCRNCRNITLILRKTITEAQLMTRAGDLAVLVTFAHLQEVLSPALRRPDLRWSTYTPSSLKVPVSSSFIREADLIQTCGAELLLHLARGRNPQMNVIFLMPYRCQDT